MERPDDPADLYRALGEDVLAVRPILTGDVFVDVEVIAPDGERSRQVIMVLDHPCSLRLDGVNLASRLTVAEVRPGAVGSWRGSYNRMPLPGLLLDGQVCAHVGYFDSCYQVGSAQLEPHRRIACLSVTGINLLLQRRVHHFSRVVVPTLEFQKSNTGVYDEVDLIEEWCDTRGDDDVKVLEATAECVAWLREDTGGTTRQELLRDPQKRSAIRQQMRSRIKELRTAAS